MTTQSWPSDDFDDTLRALWADLLKVTEITDDSSFFELGGHSMLAARLMSRVRKAVGGADLPVRLIFDHPVFADFTAALAAALRGTPGGTTGRPRRPAASTGPLSLQQRQTMAVEEAFGPSPTNNVVVAVELGAQVDPATLRRALRALVNRHDLLRVAVHRAGPEHLQAVSPPVPLDAVELEVLEATPGPAVRSRVRRMHLRPFELSVAPMLRAQLVRRSQEPDCLVLHLQHLTTDGVSAQVLLEDLAADYDALAVGAQPAQRPEFNYLDYVAWQEERWPALLAESAGHWQQVVRELSGRPASRGGAPAPAGSRIARTVRTVEPAVPDRSRRWVAAAAGTDFMLFSAAVAVASARLSARSPVGLGTLLEARSSAEFHRVVGPFATSTLLSVPVGGTPAELLYRVRAELLEAQRWADVPLEMLLAGPAADADVVPADLVDLVVTMDRPARPAAGLPMSPLFDEDAPLVPPAFVGPPSVSCRPAADGGWRLTAEHPDEPGHAEWAQAILAEVEGALRRFAEPHRPL